MHSALRPKPQVKLPPSLIPFNVVTQLKKPSVKQNGYHPKSMFITKHNRPPPTSMISSSMDKSYWALGLVNSKGKYLTAETFGFKINATGSCLKKKQKWKLIYHLSNDCIYLQSSLDYYLSTDKYGRLKCDTLEIDDDCRFHLEYHSNGQWAFKSITYGTYLGGDADQLHCFSKIPEWWLPHLALHPQINLKHVLRKRYAQLDEDDEIHIDNIIPWGCESIITVEYSNGYYCIRSYNGLYFHKDGKLITNRTDETLFTIELYKGYLTFKDCNGCYLTAIGPLGMMTTRNKTPSKDEQFLLEESKQQICLMASNGKLVSIKQGVDLSANQSERDNSSIFQLEYDENLELYHIRTSNNKYWKLEGHSVQAIADKKSMETGFHIQSTGNGHVIFQSSNGKFIVPHATGQMRVMNDQLNISESCFLLKFINRPFCVFKCDFGYVAFRNKQSRTIECNKSIFASFILEEPTDGTHSDGFVYLKGSDGLYWEIANDETISVSGCEPSKFAFELCPTYSRIVIKASNGMYLQAEQNGSIQAICQHSHRATQWEF